MIKKTILALIMAIVLFSCKSDEDDRIFTIPMDYYAYTQEEKDAEIAWIENYIAENNIEGMIKSDSDLFYRIEQKGDGNPIEKDYSVLCFVKRMLPETGKVLDSTNRDLFPQGVQYDLYLMDERYGGVQEAFTLLNEGGKITIILPSFLGLGKDEGFYSDENSIIPIPPATILYKEIEVTFITRTPS